MWQALERREKCARFWWKSPKETNYSEDRGVDERMKSKWFLERTPGGVWCGFHWLMLGTGGGPL
jgi:hypothetical protein